MTPKTERIVKGGLVALASVCWAVAIYAVLDLDSSRDFARGLGFCTLIYYTIALVDWVFFKGGRA